MFDYLLKRYKVEVLNTNFWKSMKELKLYEKVFLVMIILGAILAAFFSTLRNGIGSCISVGIMLTGLVFVVFVEKIPREERRILDEIIAPSANERVKKMVKLLYEFDIDFKDEKQIDDLINQAKKEQDDCDVWKKFRNHFKGITTYIVLPIVTIFLTKFFEKTNWQILIIKAFIVFCICAILVVLISAFAITLDDIFNRKKKYLDYFIKDMNDIKLFKNKICMVTNKKCDKQKGANISCHTGL